jgi:hypothetical protein
VAILDRYINERFDALSAKHRVRNPQWEWTPRNSHFKPLINVIFITDYYETVYMRAPQYKDDVIKLLNWETCHLFKHYLDEIRFKGGDMRGSFIVPHVERKRWFPALPRFEEDADIYATAVTGMDLYQYEKLKHELWNNTYRLLL